MADKNLSCLYHNYPHVRPVHVVWY